ncbi:MAG: DUF1854 domain-containing protein [Ruminococcaceae bacterium]|nr:DUF1854 domain-containing protein [Oscillospiraceae bacterium]
MIQGLEQITDSFLIDVENATFFSSPTGLLMVKIPAKDYEGRAFLALAFPFETDEEYVCVQNEDREELGMIRSLSLLSDEAASLCRAELKKKYFAPKILKIVKLTERFGSSFWDCETDYGLKKFTVKDPHRSILRLGEDRAYVVDVDGCRYEIESLKGMDKKSHSKIELYL